MAPFDSIVIECADLRLLQPEEGRLNGLGPFRLPAQGALHPARPMPVGSHGPARDGYNPSDLWLGSGRATAGSLTGSRSDGSSGTRPLSARETDRALRPISEVPASGSAVEASKLFYPGNIDKTISPG
jgi:hypothetical protein